MKASKLAAKFGFSCQVFAATWETGPAEERDAVLKVQMPPNDWEWYIVSEVHARFDSLSHPLKEGATAWKKGFMSAPRCLTFTNGAILVSQQQKMGTLLDLVNLTKGGAYNFVAACRYLVGSGSQGYQYRVLPSVSE